MSATLHPQLEKDSFVVAQLELCTLRLMNNALYPWVILVPAREGVVEITALSAADYALLTKEIHDVCEKMQAVFAPDKMNIGALGNMVPQLHVHIIARFKRDAAWPNPVWGGASEAYTASGAQEVLNKLNI